MALNDIERKRIEKTVGEFVEKCRPAPHIRTKLDFGFRVSGQSVELFEIRPRWDRPPEVAAIEEFLAVVQKDEYACFFG